VAVNLLPRAHAQFRRTHRQQTSLQWLALLALVGGIVGGLLTHLHLANKEIQRKGLESAITSIEKRLEGKTGRVQNLDERLGLLKGLRQDVEERSNWLEILRKISLQIPESVSLSDLSFDKHRAAVFKGEAVSSAAVADALEALRGIGHFADVRLDYINEAKINDQPIYEFQITCTMPAEEQGTSGG
jgi:Tfp pilus assembly protein PilN